MRVYAAFVLAVVLAVGTAFPGSRRGTPSTGTSGKSQHVGSYTRKNGTVVRSYNRAPAGTATHAAAPRVVAPRVATRPRAGTPKASTRKSTAACATCPRDGRGRIARSETAKHDFQKSHPCPATGKASGPCPGYVVDHVTPLKRGGADSPRNMQWQTTVVAKAKDKIE
jgi:hypothetical protein